ncbi:MAG: tetratricopeptide repeat protein, partial [Minwuiales bacterium]|nr:tetratricopeptide repeat protein [Minwuiales bacterium]
MGEVRITRICRKPTARPFGLAAAPAFRSAAVGLLLPVLAACQTQPQPKLALEPPAQPKPELPAGPRIGDSVFGSYLAGRLARAERDVTAAADFFEYALAEDPDNSALLRRTFALMVADGRMARAVELAKRVQAESEADGMANLVLAMDAMRDGEFQQARDVLARARRTGFMRLLASLVVAWTHVGDSDYDAAILALDDLKETEAFEPFRLFHSGLIFDLAGREGEAETAYREAMKTAARSAVSLNLALGVLLERSGRANEAKALYEIYNKNIAANPAILAALAREGDEMPPRMVRDAAAGAAEAMYGAASALAQDRARDAAAVYLHLALHLRPDFPVAQTLLADMYELDRRWEKAIEVYRSINPRSDYSWNARIRTAWVLNQLDRHDEAIALLDSLASERPGETDALVTQADILRSQRRYGEAADRYSQALKRLASIDERHWSLFYARGIALERSQQWDRAEADFLKALELRPEQPLVLNYLGYSWADQGVNLDRAVEMIEQAVSLRPNDGYIVDSLGWVLFRMGRYEDAVGHLERA